MSSPRRWLFVGFLLLCILLTLTIDYWESQFQQYAYYFSESFLFSSFWWLFVPFWILQFGFANRENIIGWILGPIVAHTISYPALIWLISLMFFDQPFTYWQTFQYGILHYYFSLLVLYTLPIGFFIFWINRKEKMTAASVPEQPDFLVAREGDRSIHIDVQQICWFSANPPYTNIHVGEKKYLISETLKSLAAKLNPRKFVRIHKSTIVNLAVVKSHQSRQNGDYDVLLQDGTLLRLSRNYVKEFKSKLAITPRDTLS